MRHALALLLLLGPLGCTCASEAAEPHERPHPETRGDDEGLLDPVGDPSAAPPRERFVPIELSLGREAARARSWAGGAALRRREGEPDPRASLGNWLCRLWALYGPPPGLPDGGFRYVLRDTELDYVLVAYADERGPAMGAVITNEEGHRIGDEDRIARSVDDFVRLVEATRPIDCELSVAGRIHGVRGERPISP